MPRKLPPLVVLFTATLAAQDYQPLAAIEQQVKAFVAKHPSLAVLETIGTSAGGRPILALRVAAAGAVEPDRRPAIFVGANIAGYHNAGSEAAMALLTRLTGSSPPADILKTRTFYIVPVLNPDGHDAMFGAARRRMPGHAKPIDRDQDGLTGEDPPDDLNGDGRITQMRVLDPAGTWIPDPKDSRLLVQAEPLKGQKGQYKLYTEGKDDDGDGAYNEDDVHGVQPDRNFAHAFPYDNPEAGLFASHAPESKAIMDYLLKHRNIAFAFVFGPANNLLEIPRSVGGGADPSAARIRPTGFIATNLGLDRDREYTIDEIWELAKDLPMVRQQNLTKEQLAQFLGGGPAVNPAPEDLKVINLLAEDYKKRLDKAGLDSKRSARQYQAGGFTPWLYYQYGVMAVELDVWGIPKAAAASPGNSSGDALTLEALEKMSPADFENLSDEKLAAFLKERNAPPMMTPAMLKGLVKSGQATPAQMAARVRSMGAGGGAAAPLSRSGSDLMAWIDANAPQAFVPWTPVTLPGGIQAEVGGPDPFVDIAPPYRFLLPAIEAHVETVLDAASKLAELEVAAVSSEPLSSGVWKVKATARNKGVLPTHTQQATRARTYLPVRLEINPGLEARLLHGRRFVVSERLEGGTNSLQGEWIIQAKAGTEISFLVTSDNAGEVTAKHRLGGQQ